MEQCDQFTRDWLKPFTWLSISCGILLILVALTSFLFGYAYRNYELIRQSDEIIKNSDYRRVK